MMSTRFRNYIPRALSAPYAAWFGVAAVLWLSLWNAQTYVCPQDPSTIYLPLARSIADTGFSLESIRSTASWMAPGWPCVLAMSMKVGGPFAPAWIQLPIGCLFLLAFWRLLVRLTGNPAAAWLAVWATVLSWVAGPGNTFAFLFYPFRELPGLTLTLWAVERAAGGRRPVAGLAAAGLIAGVALVRETLAPVALTGALLAAILREGRPRERAARVAWLLAPLLALAVLYAVVSDGANRQVAAVLSNLRLGLLPASPPAALLALIRALAAQMTFVGLLAALVPLARPGTRPAAIILLGMTGCALAVHMLLPPHPRYTITCAALLPGLAGLGLACLPPSLAHRVKSFALPLLVLVSLGFALTRKPWGEEVTRSDVRRTLRTVSDLLEPGYPLYMEPANRTLASCLRGFTSAWPQGNPAHPREGGLCLQPMNAAAHEDPSAASRRRTPVDFQIRMAGYDLLPARGDTGAPLTILRLGRGEYALHKVSPYPQREAVRALSGAHDPAECVYWIDLLALPADDRVLVELLDGDSIVVDSWSGLEGGKLHGVKPSQGGKAGAARQIRIRSPRSVPFDFLFAVLPVEEYLKIRPWMLSVMRTDRPVRGPGGWIQCHGWQDEDWRVLPAKRRRTLECTLAWTDEESGLRQLRNAERSFRIRAGMPTRVWSYECTVGGLGLRPAAPGKVAAPPLNP